MSSCWNSIPGTSAELSLADVLPTGQAFRWIKTKEDPTEWTGVILDRLFSLYQTKDELKFCKHNKPTAVPPHQSIEDSKLLHDYFQLDISCDKLVQEWSKNDKTIAKAASLNTGIRLLKQDPFETLISFLCSTNNNLPRITSMIRKLCSHYGTPLGVYCGREYYQFPDLKDLSVNNVEENLREMGFGYRAKYIANTVQYIIIKTHGHKWLNSLRDTRYEEAWLALQEMPGVGPKVADCVCLMGLGMTEAVPIDTHILQLAVKEYGVKVNGKSLSRKKYQEIGDMFRAKFGVYSGWAQAVSIVVCSMLFLFYLFLHRHRYFFEQKYVNDSRPGGLVQ